jgi:hypothetical protein
MNNNLNKLKAMTTNMNKLELSKGFCYKNTKIKILNYRLIIQTYIAKNNKKVQLYATTFLI